MVSLPPANSAGECRMLLQEDGDPTDWVAPTDSRPHSSPVENRSPNTPHRAPPPRCLPSGFISARQSHSGWRTLTNHVYESAAQHFAPLVTSGHPATTALGARAGGSSCLATTGIGARTGEPPPSRDHWYREQMGRFRKPGSGYPVGMAEPEVHERDHAGGARHRGRAHDVLHAELVDAPHAFTHRPEVPCREPS